MASAQKLLVEIIGDAKSFLKSVDQADGGAGKLGNTFKKLAVGAAGAFAVKEVADFGKASVDKFQQVAGETAKLQRVTGGTAEEMSRLRFAASQVGLSSDQLTGAFGKFSKAGLGPAAKGLAEMGISFKDAHGNAKPLKDSLEAVADKFKTLPGGAEKNALALKLFGRSGIDLLPILNKGKVGIEELMAKSDEFGMTIGQDGVDNLKKYKLAQRDMTAAMDGLKVTIGGAIMPALAGFVGFLARTAQPVFAALRTAFKDHIVPAAEMLWQKMQPVVEVIKSLVHHVADFFSHNPQSAFAAVAVVVGGVLVAAFWALASAVAAAFSPILLIVAAVAGVVAVVVWAYNHFTWFRDGVQAAWTAIKNAAHTVVEWFKSTAWPAIKTVIHWIGDKFGELVGWVHAHMGEIKKFIGNVWGSITGFFSVAWTVIKAIVSTGVDVVMGLWHQFGDSILKVFRGAWTSISGILKGGWEEIQGIFAFINDLFHGRWSKLWDDAKRIFSGMWDAVVGFFKGLPLTLLGLLGDAGMWLVHAGGKIVGGLLSGITSGAEWIWGWLKKLPGSIVSTIGDLGRTLYHAGASLIGGLWDGMKAIGSGAVDVARSIANGIIGFLNSSMIGSLNSSLDMVWRNIPFTSGKFPFHLPSIPKFHTGGVYSDADEGLALLRRGEGVFTPEQMSALGAGVSGSAGGGSTYHITVQAGVVTDQRALGSILVDAITAHERTNGKAWRAA